MIRINENYLKLKASYLFADIARRVNAFQQGYIWLAWIYWELLTDFIDDLDRIKKDAHGHGHGHPF